MRGVRLEGQKPSSSTIRSLGFAKWVSFSSRLPSARALASRATSVGAFTNSTLYGRYGRAADRDGQVRLADAGRFEIRFARPASPMAWLAERYSLSGLQAPTSCTGSWTSCSTRIGPALGPTTLNLAVLRRIALNLAKANTAKGSIRGKTKKAGWDSAFLAALILQMR